MSMNYEAYLEARRLERELRDRKIDRLKRLGPLPERDPSSGLLRRQLGGLTARLRGVMARPREMQEDGAGAHRPAASA